MLKRRWFDMAFLVLGLLIQVVTYAIASQSSIFNFQFSIVNSQLSIISLISGCLGVCSVCLASQGNILTYVFGFAQVITYTYICWTQRLYAEIAINAYYFVTMIYGVFVWRQNIKHQTSAVTHQTTVTPRSLSCKLLALLSVATILGASLIGWGLDAFTDDSQPYLDAFTTVPALVAQVLMILVYREHWFIWLAVDILSIALWFRAGDYCMVAQYAFWCANCLYGLRRWASLRGI